MPSPQYVAVIGKGRNCPAQVRRLALGTGAALARLHPAAVLICGGLGGVMDAAAQGMTAAGGVAIGLIPAAPPGQVSEHLTYAIRTGLPVAYRDITTASAADLAVVLPGSNGTCIEGWAADDRGVPLIGVGDHTDWPTAALPCSAWADLAVLPALVAELLGLADVG